MAGDPSIRGLTGALETGLAGVKRGQANLDNAARPFTYIRETVEKVLAKDDPTFSWRELVSPKPLTDADKRAFIEIKPIIDYEAPEPGKDATDAIRKAASELKFAEDYHARVRHRAVLIATQNSTVREGAIINGIGTISHRARHPGWLVGESFRRVCPVHRACHHHRRRPLAGGIAEPAVNRLRRAVCRSRRRLRHPVQRALPLGALQERQSG
jgi:hypothetical protein